MHLEDEVGDVIAKARVGNGLSAAQLATAVGLTETQLSDIESYRLTPNADIISRLADTLHLNAKKLIGSANAAWTPASIDPSGDKLIVRQVHVPIGAYSENAYIAACAQSRSAAVIDPGGAVEEIRNVITELQLDLELVLITHAHGDHIGGLAALLRQMPNVTVVCSALDKNAVMNGVNAGWQSAEEVAKFPLGHLEAKALTTPGHTAGSVCYAVDGACFVGDTLFAGSIGRPSSSAIYEPMLHAIKSKVLNLPGDTILLPGHGPITTAAEELEHNPFF